ncbi:mannose-6-phosphate isomerase, type 1 [Natronincola peptidivorans]|uniref:mannose-6-phosphate isomerase n=1 Tax=Natronincola peptidivorans TaxID=426128 RepID=A0A1I0AZC1_9FIRM|nr:mannose-6-phosphate isomerase, class I [Natronincola peptidivorans]SES99783.1 mannose-6-phosphate isomerase, type 1 [Natronincola peptidivorans]
MEIIFLDKIFHEKIWGGNRIKTHFGYDIDSEGIGECWTVSAHPNGDCKVIYGEYKDKTLSWLWKNKRHIFGNIEGDRFPLLTKIIDAKDDLSVQVHPNDDYADTYENGEFGKTECWYIIDCDEGAELIIGHHANDKKQMKEMIKQGLWNELLKKTPIKPGDFFYIPSGTIHAIGKGSLILEIQQSSDITYRVYDYDRLENGQPRELHINKSIEVATIPHKDYKISRSTEKIENGYKESLIQEKYFSVHRLQIEGRLTYKHNNKFKIINVLNGVGSVDGIDIKKGDHFIIPCDYGPLSLQGDLELMVSHL